VITVGIDLGALWAKAAVVRDGALAGWAAAPTGERSEEAAQATVTQALAAAGAALEEVAAVAATGAGRGGVALAQVQLGDIACAARGARFLLPRARAVLDLGGESTRAIALDEAGRVIEFAVNDKCAAGTGVFLDAVAKVMRIGIEEMGPLSLESTADVQITSMCVVFAESEVVSQIHRRTPIKDILRGVHRSIATRVHSLLSRLSVGEGAVAVGGLARNVGLMACLAELTGRPLPVPREPQIASALGAALIVAEGGGVQ
jgi:predicted CoA-substrate-specific enzyme activase